MDHRKKLVLLIFTALLGLECLEAGTMPASVQAEPAEKLYPGIVRFHVIANSNSQEDQELKLKVRDHVMPRLEKELTAELLKLPEEMRTETGEKTVEAYISSNLEKISGWAGECLRKNGSGYEVKTELAVRAIPAKQYDDIYFPAGNYEALTIKIGKAEGKNWWCVVFPPLCLVDSSGSAYNDNFNIGAKDRIVIKSKVKELLAAKDMHKKDMPAKKKTRQKT